MLPFLKKIFKKQKTRYFKIGELPSFDKFYRFKEPDEQLKLKLELSINDLKDEPELLKENLVSDKELITFTSKENLIQNVYQDLRDDYDEYSKEFNEDAFSTFEYFLGNSIFFNSGLEITRRVFNRITNKAGLYSSLLIKRHNNFITIGSSD